jgi:hypothetical protein
VGKQPPYDQGDEVELAVEFSDKSQKPADPAQVTIELICPDGQTLSWDASVLDHPSVGLFSHRYLVANGPGWYRMTARGSGNITAVRQESFPVQETQAQEAALAG